MLQVGKVLKILLRKSGLLPFFYHNLNKILPSFESLHPANLKALKSAFGIAPAGDYFEFGVYKGFSFWFAIQVAELNKINSMRFYGFDSFNGLPEPVGMDKEKDRYGGTFARGNFCAYKDFVNDILVKYGCDPKKFQLIEGFFEDVLKKNIIHKYKMKKAGVILIDCDLYESTKTVLAFIPLIIQHNTVILFDDWDLIGKNKGQQLAFKEWKMKHPEYNVKECCPFEGGRGFQIKLIN